MALNFILRPLSLVDLVSLMPLFLGDSFRSAAFLRVLRILKIARLLQVRAETCPDQRVTPFIRTQAKLMADLVDVDMSSAAPFCSPGGGAVAAAGTRHWQDCGCP